METTQHYPVAKNNQIENLNYDGEDMEIHPIEEYGNDPYNFYPDAVF